jgi:hypothetical protein
MDILLTIAAGPPNQGLGGIYIHGSVICQVIPMTNQLTCRNGEIGKLTSRDVTFNKMLSLSLQHNTNLAQQAQILFDSLVPT